MKTQCSLWCLLGTMFVAGCSSAPTSPEDPSLLDPASARLTAASSKSALASGPSDAAVPSLDEWRKMIRKVTVPKEGCFKATHPATTWTEVPCATPPDSPLGPPRNPHGAASAGPENIGRGNDWVAQAPPSSVINTAIGDFVGVTGLTSEIDLVPNNYSLQLNAIGFTSTQIQALCNGNPACAGAQGGQQFAFLSTQSDPAVGVNNSTKVFIQYWLLGWNTTCPTGWNTSGSNCWKNSPDAIPLPSVQPITNLGKFSIQGNAGTTDQVWFADGDGTEYTTGPQTSVLGLNQNWTWAEFNVFGHSDSTEACFNAGTSFTVQTGIGTNSPTGGATCQLESNLTGIATLETNNLTLGSCAEIGGSGIIQFTENNPQSCVPGNATYWPVAMEANAAGGNNLYIESYNSYGSFNEGLGMQPGTVPSLVVLPPPSNNLAIAFQANTRHLWVEQTDVTGGTILSASDQGAGSAMNTTGVTSPSIAATSGGSLVIAYQGSNGDLWLEQSGPGSGGDTFLGMAQGTSPSVGVMTNGNIVAAFQAAGSGHLYIYENGGNRDLGLGMWPGTSPSIAINPSGGYDVVFQAASSGHLWLVQVLSSVFNGFNYNDEGLGMKSGTSPSVMFNGSVHWAFQANTGNLYVDFTDQHLPMRLTASPTILALPAGGNQVAYEGSNADLWLDINGHGIDMFLGMNP